MAVLQPHLHCCIESQRGWMELSNPEFLLFSEIQHTIQYIIVIFE